MIITCLSLIRYVVSVPVISLLYPEPILVPPVVVAIVPELSDILVSVAVILMLYSPDAADILCSIYLESSNNNISILLTSEKFILYIVSAWYLNLI